MIYRTLASLNIRLLVPAALVGVTIVPVPVSFAISVPIVSTTASTPPPITIATTTPTMAQTVAIVAVVVIVLPTTSTFTVPMPAATTAQPCVIGVVPTLPIARAKSISPTPSSTAMLTLHTRSNLIVLASETSHTMTLLQVSCCGIRPARRS